MIINNVWTILLNIDKKSHDCLIHVEGDISCILTVEEMKLMDFMIDVTIIIF